MAEIRPGSIRNAETEEKFPLGIVFGWPGAHALNLYSLACLRAHDPRHEARVTALPVTSRA